jgi:hypothetical protein
MFRYQAQTTQPVDDFLALQHWHICGQRIDLKQGESPLRTKGNPGAFRTLNPPDGASHNLFRVSLKSFAFKEGESSSFTMHNDFGSRNGSKQFADRENARISM